VALFMARDRPKPMPRDYTAGLGTGKRQDWQDDAKASLFRIIKEDAIRLPFLVWVFRVD
jgi:hypothetical protein